MLTGMLLALLSGALVGLQTIGNSKVNERVGLWTTTTLVLGLGFAASMTLGLLMEGAGLFRWQAMKPWNAFSGLLGIGVVACLTQGVRRLGPTLAVSLSLTTQLAVGLLGDTFGWFGLQRVPFSAKQGIGAAAIIGGVLLLKLCGGQAARVGDRPAEAQPGADPAEERRHRRTGVSPGRD